MIFVEVGPKLGVATGREPVASLDQRFLQLRIFKDLAILRDPDRAVFIADRLPSARQIDDRKPSCPEGNARLDVNLLVVRPSVRDRGRHRQQSWRGEFTPTS